MASRGESKKPNNRTIMCCDCAYILGAFVGIGVFLVFHRPIIKVLERILGITPLDDFF
jgi:hypothetical protein